MAAITKFNLECKKLWKAYESVSIKLTHLTKTTNNSKVKVTCNSVDEILKEITEPYFITKRPQTKFNRTDALLKVVGKAKNSYANLLDNMNGKDKTEYEAAMGLYRLKDFTDFENAIIVFNHAIGGKSA